MQKREKILTEIEHLREGSRKQGTEGLRQIDERIQGVEREVFNLTESMTTKALEAMREGQDADGVIESTEKRIENKRAHVGKLKIKRAAMAERIKELEREFDQWEHGRLKKVVDNLAVEYIDAINDRNRVEKDLEVANKRIMSVKDQQNAAVREMRKIEQRVPELKPASQVDERNDPRWRISEKYWSWYDNGLLSILRNLEGNRNTEKRVAEIHRFMAGAREVYEDYQSREDTPTMERPPWRKAFLVVGDRSLGTEEIGRLSFADAIRLRDGSVDDRRSVYNTYGFTIENKGGD
jgi:chromosome segregation ATPase